MLKKKNIVLRPLQNSDFYFLKRIENNTDNWQFGSERKEYSNKELSAYITNAKTDIKVAKQYRFVIDLNGSPIGFIDLFDYTTNSAGVGVIIAENYRNKGFAKEALMLLIEHAVSTVNLCELHCDIAKDNLLSMKLFTACGFKLKREEIDYNRLQIKLNSIKTPDFTSS
jgi:diamine N-acetyltransferase